MVGRNQTNNRGGYVRMRIAIIGFLASFATAPVASPLFAEDFVDHLFIKVGDMRPGSGIGGGLEYRDNHFQNGLFDIRIESKVSIRLYQQHEIEIIKPHLLDPRLFFELFGLYRSYTQVDYFGIGPDTSKDAHSNYRLDGFVGFGTIGFRPARKLQLGVRLGAIQADVGSGTDGNLPSVEERFDPDSLPGFREEPDHFLLGAFVTFDYRDDPEDPAAGGYVELQVSRYRDLGLDKYNFEDYEVDVRHYFRVHRRTVLAVRSQGLFTHTARDQTIPFFLLPSLGGSETLHAYENDRFRDQHMVHFNSELRYEVTPEIRAELFIDAGEVFPRFDAFRLGELELSAGFGGRYKLGRDVVGGASLGFGREGVRIAFKGDFRF